MRLSPRLSRSIATVVCVQAKGMKEPWCLAASTADEPTRALINLYARRWGIECSFRDTKDLRFGMGLGSMHVSTPDRRDRLWLINAFAVVLLTLLGAAGEGSARPTPQVQHDQAAHALAVPAGKHALRTHARHDKVPPAATDRAVRRDAGKPTGLCTDFRCRLKMRGVMRGAPPLSACADESTFGQRRLAGERSQKRGFATEIRLPLAYPLLT